MAPRPRRWWLVEGGGKAEDWRPGCTVRAPEAEPSTGGGMMGRRWRRQRSPPGSRQHLWRRRPRPTCISGHRGGQTFTSNLMLHYWKDVPALIEDHWNTGPQGQTNTYMQHPRKYLFYSGHHAGIFCVRISNISSLIKIMRILFELQSEVSC